MSAPQKSRKHDDFEKHRTGRAAQTSDFVKHDCPNKVTAWEKGLEVKKAIVVKAEFSRIKGNENFVPINTMAHDACPFCNTDVDDTSMVPCTEEDVEALRK